MIIPKNHFSYFVNIAPPLKKLWVRQCNYPYHSLDGTSGHEESCLPIAKSTYSRLCPHNLQFPLPLPPQEKPHSMRMLQKVFVALLRKLSINKAF
ncbi:hypothetical protein L3X38_021862 [Prunus dulcis]|uniref:Uncharacterized protein n=1 Tax=Prunus dulcis TaxID=3755 RepID=A0AAD4VVU4_PRUDU|nr:hypothetical protein L3X38_021862 [Prunus dulcis]